MAHNNQVNDNLVYDLPDESADIDIYVGGRLKAQRLCLGMSQEKLAQAVGLTFQQVQKYERGSNRIAASRLYQFSKVLCVSVSYFFEGIDKIAGLSEDDENEDQKISLNDPGIWQLINAYRRINNPKLRQKLLDVAKLLGDPTEDSKESIS